MIKLCLAELSWDAPKNRPCCTRILMYYLLARSEEAGDATKQNTSTTSTGRRRLYLIKKSKGVSQLLNLSDNSMALMRQN